ncbi:MAG: pilus assembly protein N-terminal domain-containing protein [Lautropia sp.]|nr:pilus assembly protein N-terminal domain-containing protein [Lautropia sp.]
MQYLLSWSAVGVTGIGLCWASVIAAQPLPVVINLAVGQAHVLDERNVRRIAVGNGRVVQVTALDQRQILLLPEAPGQSTLHLWGPGGAERQYLINVAATDARRTAEEINQLLNNSPRIRAHAIGDKVVLDGSRPTEEDAFRSAEVIKRYPQAISLISRGGFERMIDMEVRMIEIGKNALDRLGVRWQSGSGMPYAIEGPTFGLIGDFKRSDPFRPGGSAGAAGFPVRPRISPFAATASLMTSLTSMVDLLVQNGDAAVLAEPRLSCRSGGSARFVAGGELPIPVIGANGSASVQFKEYGVRFEVSPTINDQGVISASLHAEISSINPEVMVREVPGLRKQSAATDVNLREGETLVIAGMISNEFSGAVDKIPGLGDLPILGKLFRSRRFQNRETELIVLITPRLHVDGSTYGAEQGAQTTQKLEALRDKIRMLD